MVKEASESIKGDKMINLQSKCGCVFATDEAECRFEDAIEMIKALILDSSWRTDVIEKAEDFLESLDASKS